MLKRLPDRNHCKVCSRLCAAYNMKLRERRAVFVRFSLGGGQSFDWRLVTIAGMEVAKLVPWNSLLKLDHVGLYRGVSGV